MKKVLVLLSFIVSFSNCKKSKQLEISSPNGEIKIVLNNKTQKLTYTFIIMKRVLF